MDIARFLGEDVTLRRNLNQSAQGNFEMHQPMLVGYASVLLLVALITPLALPVFTPLRAQPSSAETDGRTSDLRCRPGSSYCALTAGAPSRGESRPNMLTPAYPRSSLTTVGLGQSPFLNFLSDERVRQILMERTRSPNERLRRDLAREVCQPAGSKAYLAGSIAALGTQYVINLEALNCASGDTLAREQTTVAGKEQVLPMLGQAASRLRRELGESLGSVQKFDVPLEQATTNSLEALKQNVSARPDALL